MELQEIREAIRQLYLMMEAINQRLDDRVDPDKAFEAVQTALRGIGVYTGK
jgi:hypothetical protein